MTDAKADKITIERETLGADIGALEAYEAITGRKSAVLAHLRAAMEAQPPVPLPEPVERLMRFAGKRRRDVSNPCLTAREAIVIADYMAACVAAPPAPAAVPPGYVLVPIEPTREMEMAADTYASKTANRPKGFWWWGNVYRAMIAAAGDKP